MSPRAAWRLERLGFTNVYDYVAGKVDWMAAGLPTARADASERRALDAADRKPATCSPETVLADLPVAHATIVVNDAGVVLGRVSRSADEDPQRTAEEVMHPGPATVRASEPLDPLLDRMADRRVDEIIVTSPQGRLLGVVHRSI